MVANLYRGRDYCQIWTQGLVLVTHRGVIGQRGVVTERVVASTEAEEQVFQQAVREAEAEGYVPLEKIPNSQMLVNYKVSNWEDSEIQSFKNTLQSLLGDILGWTGNGCCDGFTLGREGLTMWCIVVDADLALPTLLAGLEKNRLLHDEEGMPDWQYRTAIAIAWFTLKRSGASASCNRHPEGVNGGSDSLLLHSGTFRHIVREAIVRRIRYAVATSLDGYIAGPKGEFDWIVRNPDIDFRPFFDQFDTALLGRRTYEVTLSPDAPPWPPEMSLYVFSRTLRQADHPEVTIVADKLEETVAGLRAMKSEKDIWLFGGGLLFRSLLNAGLVDTVEVAISPVLLGEGLPLLSPPANEAKLKLTGHKVYQTGIVSLEYAVQ